MLKKIKFKWDLAPPPKNIYPTPHPIEERKTISIVDIQNKKGGTCGDPSSNPGWGILYFP